MTTNSIDAKKDSVRDRSRAVLRALRAQSEPVMDRVVSAACGMHVTDAREGLVRLERDGLVQRHRHPKMFLPRQKQSIWLWSTTDAAASIR